MVIAAAAAPIPMVRLIMSVLQLGLRPWSHSGGSCTLCAIGAYDDHCA